MKSQPNIISILVGLVLAVGNSRAETATVDSQSDRWKGPIETKPKDVEFLESYLSSSVLDKWTLLEAQNLSTIYLYTSETPTVMISYSHADAIDEARSLKKALEAMNLSVYLDSDEIFPGTDWQDSLNHAISGCHTLVALVTPSYGKTQWTGRELKLADLLGKQIIPVRINQQWPPPYLGIQLSTVQYIKWDEVDKVAALISQTVERDILMKQNSQSNVEAT